MTRKDEIIKILEQHQRGGSYRPYSGELPQLVERCICGATPLVHRHHLADMLLAVGPSN